MVHRIGVDENGLGPRLGPMTITGTLITVRGSHDAFARVAADVGVGDSKGLCAHGAMRDVERLVLAMLDVHLGQRPTSLAALVGALSLHDDAWLRAPCPSGEAPRMCYDAAVALPAYGGDVTDAARADARALREVGATLRGVRTVLVCAERFHLAKAEGKSRFDVDLDAMIDIVRALQRDVAPDEVVAACGKVGGRARYLSAVDRLGALPIVEEEKRSRSAYRVRGFGSLAFVQDGDATDPAIALASLFGKYLRELTMERIHRYFAARVEGLSPASGYHDPVTTKYIARTELVRRRDEIPDRCFER